MEIRRIFTKKGEGRLWAVVCPSSKSEGKKSDVLTELFRQLTDTNYLLQFFTSNRKDLNAPIWNGISIDEAIDKVIEEVNHIEAELYAIELKTPGYENRSLSEIFLPLHETHEFTINFRNDRYRKGKPDFHKPMVRIYAIELDDGTFVVSGGAIKLIKDMRNALLIKEKEKLDDLRDFLKKEDIYNFQGLTNL